MHIFLFSTPYIERLLLRCIDMDDFEDYIITLKNNHPEDIGEKCNKICLVNNLTDALSIADLVYIFANKDIPLSTIEKCREICTCRNIPVLCQTISYINDSDISPREFIHSIPVKHLASKPVIMILGIGHASQIERAEYRICKMLHSKNVIFKLFSDTFLPTFEEFICKINCGFRETYGDSKEAQLSVISFSIPQDLLLINSAENLYFDIFMRQLRPDCLILCCENNVQFEDKLNELFVNKYSKSIDAFVNSEYITYKYRNSPFSQIYTCGNNSILNLDRIIDKLAFPKGIKVLI